MSDKLFAGCCVGTKYQHALWEACLADDCPNGCDEGRIWNNCDPTSGQWVACDACPMGDEA